MNQATSVDHAPLRSRRTTALLAAVLSLIVPGAGQLLLGYRRRGLLMLGITLLLVAGAMLLWRRGLIELVVWLVQPRILIAAVALNADSNAPKQAKVLSKPVHLRELVTEVQKMLAA